MDFSWANRAPSVGRTKRRVRTSARCLTDLFYHLPSQIKWVRLTGRNILKSGFCVFLAQQGHTVVGPPDLAPEVPPTLWKRETRWSKTGGPSAAWLPLIFGDGSIVIPVVVREGV